MDTFDLKPDAPAEYPRRVQSDRDERPRHGDQRAPAQAGPMCRQVRDPPRRHPHARRSRAGHRIRQHRQPAAAVAGISRLRRGRHEGTRRTARTCRRSSRFPTATSGPASWACNMPRSTPAARPQGRPAIQRPRHLARQRPDDRRSRTRQNLLADLDKTFAGCRDRTANCSTASTGSASRPTPSSPAGAPARRSTSARNRPTFAKPFGDDAFGRAACWPRGWSRRACASSRSRSAAGTRTATTGPRSRHELCRRSTPASSALLNGLSEKGLLDTTTVFVTGEFGRTPKINTREQGGRDHYPRCMFMLMAGGGVKGGQVLGESDDNATAAQERRLHARRRRRVVLPHARHRPHQGIPHQHRPPDHDRPRRQRDPATVCLVVRSLGERTHGRRTECAGY